MQLVEGGGNGADPDLYAYPNGVMPVNAYLPAYPVDAALARYAQRGDVTALAALGVGSIVNRPWLVSRSNGEIGLAAASLPSRKTLRGIDRSQSIPNPAPLLGTCSRVRIVGSPTGLQACDLFLSDAPNAATFSVAQSSSDSIDARTGWIDASLAFARDPSLAQGLGGVLTQSRFPLHVVPNAWLLAYVRGSLHDGRGRALVRSTGTFGWVWLPATTDRVTCYGICEVVGEMHAFPAAQFGLAPTVESPVAFDMPVPWLIRVRRASGTLLRFNARYDSGWLAIEGLQVLPHVRSSLAANGWFVRRGFADVILLQMTALVQLFAELAGVACTVFLLKALFRRGTKRI
jgi:hypothetical protein